MTLTRRFVAYAFAALVLVGCAADDPLVFEVTSQTTAPPTDGDASGNDAGDDDATGDDAVFPPVNADIARPAEIVDLRGQDIVQIEIRDNVFDERFFRVDPGTQIVFTNRGANTHNVTASAEGAFPTITAEALEAAPQALVLDVEGDYPFYCTIHGTATRGQTGYVVVGGG